MAKRNWVVIAGGVVVLVLLLGLIAGLQSNTPRLVSSTPTAPAAPSDQRMTLDPQVVLNVTNLPHATPLSAADAAPYEALRQMVNACADYRDDRRRQVIQHIDWLIDPSTIPADMVAIALGTNPQGRLIFGMATTTQNQWRLDGEKPDSCLIPIGVRLNEMLVAAGEAALPAFATPSP